MYNMTIEIGIKFEIKTISSVNGGDDKIQKRVVTRGIEFLS